MLFRGIITLFCITVLQIGAQAFPVQSIPVPNHGYSAPIGLSPQKQIRDYLHHSWQSDQGLPQNSVTALCQAHDGYLWIGTQEGLVRFDGVRFTLFDKKSIPSFKSNVITCLLEDKTGVLWVGTRGGGLVKLHQGVFSSYSAVNGLSNDIVYALAEERRNDNNQPPVIWVGTDGGGINRLEGDSCSIYTTTNGLAHNVVSSLLLNPAGKLWIGTRGGGVQEFYRGKFTNYTTMQGLSNNEILSLAWGHDGGLWIGTLGGGVNKLLNGLVTRYSTKQGLSNDVVYSLLVDSFGAVWAGTWGGGINRIWNTTISSFTSADGLSNNIVYSLLCDREGALWIGTLGGGLNRLKESVFTTFTSKHGLNNEGIRSVIQDEKGALCFGTEGGGVNRWLNGKMQVLTTKHGLPQNIIRSLLVERTGKPDNTVLWVGTLGEGVARVQNGKITKYSTQNGLVHNSVPALVQDADGSIWIGTFGGGLQNFVQGQWKTYSTNTNLTHNNVYTLVAAPGGGVWAGTFGGGVNFVRDGAVQSRLTSNEGLSNNFVRSLYIEQASLQHSTKVVLWIGTQGGGLNRYQNGRCTAITTVNGLFDDTILGIIEDGLGFMWFSSNKGIFRVAKRDLDGVADGKQSFVRCRVFGTADGMKNAECNGGCPAIWKDTEGKLWFPTIRGVAVVNPREIRFNTLPPPVLVENWQADTLPLSGSQAAALPASVSKLEFRYTATSLSTPEKVLFRYVLEGYDKTWVEAGTRRTAYYTNLPRGREYRFHVIASNNDGIWNTAGAVISFSIDLYWYETWWFYTYCGIMVFSAGLIGYRLRVERLFRRARNLEQMVAERTEALREANDKIQRQLAVQERQAKEIQQNNTSLQEQNLQLEKLNTEKNEVLGIVSHDLRNPLTSIMMSLYLIEKQWHQMSLQDIMHRLSNAQKASLYMKSIIEKLLDVNHIEEGKMSIHPANFRITPLLSNLLHEYRDAAVAKNLELHLHSENPDVKVFADTNIVITIMDNLLSNAVKYSPPGKNIYIRVTNVLPTLSEKNERLFVEHGWEISGSVDDHLTNDSRFISGLPFPSVRIEVQDEGPGLNDDDKTKVFGKFSRLSARPTAGETSTGLGLSIVKKMTELLQGRVWCESEAGCGATFLVELPAAVHSEPLYQ